MATYTQEDRLLELTTPLGENKLLIRSIDGMEGISQLFSFRVEAFAFNEEEIDFSRLVGQPICVRVILDQDSSARIERFYHGMVQTVTRGARGTTTTSYSLQAVPRFWFLTRTTQSRIFQQKTVPDILKVVLAGIPASYDLQGTYEPRDYCAQYRESDFDFASRLMEEEGICYFFRHELDGHTMVVADTSSAHKDLPHSPSLFFDPDVGGQDDAEIIYSWEKTQTLRSGKTTLWDHSFELPHNSLQAQDLILDTLAVGNVTHKLKVGGNENMELFDYPGGYAERFDGVSPSGGDQPSQLQKIYSDNTRTTKIRMQQEAVNSIVITGYTAYLGIASGYKFNLERHYQDNDAYLITRSHFSIPQKGGYAAGDEPDAPPPEIVMNCIPLSLPFRPQRVSAKPVVFGTQTAVVVGPAGEEIFTDKYGRVKVQFLWDRDGQFNGTSSCWVRCGFPWAGKNFGFISIPRVGHEVIVAFEEGDPDQPIIMGSVYNADMMPPYTLPENKTMSAFKSRSSLGGGGFNELRFEDKKDAEQVFFHAQKNMDTRVLNDRMEWIGNDTHLIVKRDQLETIERDFQRTVHRDVVEEIKRDRIMVIKGKDAVETTGSSTSKTTGNVATEIGGKMSMDVTGDVYLNSSGKIVIESTSQISLKVGGSFVDIGTGGVTIVGTMVKINSGGAAGSGSKGNLNATKAATAPAVAATADPGGHKEYTGGSSRTTSASSSSSSSTSSSSSSASSSSSPGSTAPPPPAPAPEPTHNPNTPENETKTHWVGIKLKDRTGKPIAGQAYKVVLPGGDVAEGTLDDEGKAKVEHTDPGECQVSFPGLADWEKA
ncbi:MAG: type VI secretion system tip protein TssI/VgrG [Bryobacteraceae bacterium]